MRVLNYNFEDYFKSLSHLMSTDSKSGYNVSKCLNNFFEDLNCHGVTYTNNIDNEFFGIYVKSMHMDPKRVMDLENKDSMIIKDYMVEIDSKLANILTPVELGAIIIYEIKNIVSFSALSKFRDAITYYLGMNQYSINLENMVHHDKLFELMYDESVASLYSVFRQPTDELICADEFMMGCGLSDAFNDAIEKIKRLKDSIFVNELSNKLLVMQWYISVINDINTDTRYVSTILRDCFQVTGSRLLRTDILNAIKELEPMTDSVERYYTSLTESSANKKKSLFGQIKDSGLRSLEQDVYEYTMRIKNIEDENDALLLMRQINNRIAILEDYLNSDDVDDRLYDRWSKVLDKYLALRESLTKKTVYKQKMYGLFADYNVLQQMYMRGELQTIY